mgnify:CR=1 FL=1
MDKEDKKNRETSFNKRGRPNLVVKGKLELLLKLYYTKTYSIRKLAQILGVSKTTVLRTITTNFTGTRLI